MRLLTFPGTAGLVGIDSFPPPSKPIHPAEMKLSDFFTVDGRMPRRPYLIAYGIALALTLALAFAMQQTGIQALGYLRLIILAALIPSSVRRLHDLGYSGWLVIGVFLIPCVSIFLLVMPGEPGTNAYGPNPREPAA